MKNVRMYPLFYCECPYCGEENLLGAEGDVEFISGEERSCDQCGDVFKVID